MKFNIIEAWTRPRNMFLRLGIGVHYAEKDGSMVLRHKARWNKICGIWINTPWGCVWLRFRRFYK